MGEGVAGLLAGMQAASTDWVVTVPCDSPNFPLDLVARMVDVARANPCTLLVVAQTPVQTHPVFMLAHRDLTPQLAAFLASGERKMGFWQKQNGAVFADFADEAAFANLNTPAELAALETRLPENDDDDTDDDN